MPSRSTLWFVTALAALSTAAPALTGIQVGSSGKTYASAALACALHPTRGWAPQVQAGLYNPARHASATVAQNGVALATVTQAQPDTLVWLDPALDRVTVSVKPRQTDAYDFDARPLFPGQLNVCLPDTRSNSVAGELEYGASGSSYATRTPGCAWNAATGRAQPFVNLFDNGAYVLNVSLNGAALTQLSSSRPHTPVFLAPGLNVLLAARGTLATDAYVRDGGTGSCLLP